MIFLKMGLSFRNLKANDFIVEFCLLAIFLIIYSFPLKRSKWSDLKERNLQ